ncbi:MAG: UDP-N-acetylmuramate dehydrogenase [Candidatus Aminicenantes bacterium]|nr:MAG: UDP-N-acetylmuramate dehydrogenase [Candidatus Aminicenantes bacterium]
MDSEYLGFKEQFSKTLDKSLRLSVSLRKQTNFKVGGRADYFFAASSLPDLVHAVRLARQHKISYYIIGGGYNLLFDDKGFRGLIIKNCVQKIVKRGTAKIEVFSGTTIQELIKFCVANAMEGFEFLAGIPGTVGGAVFGNAGAFDRDIGSFLAEARILDKRGEQVQVDRDYFAFDYRQSRLRTNRDLLLKATFLLQKGLRQDIEERIAENLANREKKHPPKEAACAGSYFKNPVLPDGKRVPAAYFLEQVGAKSLGVGGAAVFSGHANFIINKQEATTNDILSLALELKNRVKQKFGIELEEEVIYLPEELSTP